MPSSALPVTCCKGDIYTLVTERGSSYLSSDFSAVLCVKYLRVLLVYPEV